MLVEYLGMFMMIAGYILGLGAVTVIDVLGFLGRKSSYWTEATTRAHHVTKPLIWAGMLLAIAGGVMQFWNEPFIGIPRYLAMIACALVLNGLFLSFSVSPYLVQREKEGRSGELLPATWQRKIMVSLIVSDLGWWGSLALYVYYSVGRIGSG